MKRSLFLFTTIFCFSFGLVLAQETTFYQDVAEINGIATGLPSGNIDQIAIVDHTPLATTSSGQYEWKGSKWISSNKGYTAIAQPKFKGLPVEAGEVLSWTIYGSNTYVGCENGLYIDNGKNKWQQVLPSDINHSWALKEVAALTVDSKDRLWFAAKQGIGRWENGQWQLFTGKEGVPYTHFSCAAAGPQGQVWFGTENGAFRVEDDQFFYRSNRRWLPDNHVNGIAVDAEGTAWIATRKGISQIASREMTYAEKAAHFTRQVEERHNRMGFICQNHLREQFNKNSSQLAISDNDGQYTAMYGAAQAFRYAMTKDPEARELANRSFYALKWLVDITHEPGFPARVIIPVDWHEPVNEQYNRDYNRRNQAKDPFWKDIFPRFPLSDDGNYRWKCDTSSDELAGHYFYYGIYHDLIAETKEEKEAVKQVVADVTDHLIKHGFKLVDYDGKPTRWGSFDPDYFNSIWGWDQRGLNAMMMLSAVRRCHCPSPFLLLAQV